MGLHAQFALVNRRAIEEEIERLIALLDAADAPFEDVEDDDPAGGNVEDCRQVEDWRPEGFDLPMPVWAIDQSKGPANEREVCRAWQRHLIGERA